MRNLFYHCLNTVLPERLFSRLVGHLTRIRFPKFILLPALRMYIKHFNVNMDEAKRPLEDYSTFTDFFTRILKDGLRPIDQGEDSIVSPVDGKVYVSGQITNHSLLHAKGKYYTVEHLLGDAADAQRYEGGSFVTIYLSPRDYHRIHTPVSGELESFRYIPGKLLPVNPPSVALFPKLFAENERLISFINTPSGIVSLVKVGATNVGRIRLSYQDYVTNRWGRATKETQNLSAPISVEKGDEVAMFEMGSTVILLFEPGTELIDFEENQVLQLGEVIGRVVEQT